jgi:hypothetical protein
MVNWGEFAVQAPELATFGEGRLVSPAYLATIRGDGRPRVQPISPIIGSGHLFVFIEPPSPKGHDLRERASYALHNGVADAFGTGGEFAVFGHGVLIDDPALRSVACDCAGYPPEDRYQLFELSVSGARANSYGDVPLPNPRRWIAT